MCGIFGWITPSNQCTGFLELIRLTYLMSHCGPDGHGYNLLRTRDGRFSVGLGHRRLSILDLSEAAAQPMWNAEKTHCLIFNGEIYNYIELRKELQRLGERFYSSSDTEVVLTAIRSWGPEAVRRFHGMFALAMYATIDDRVIFACDPYGKKPLFIGARENSVFFSSEIEPITSSPGFDRSFNWNALDGYSLDRYVPGPGIFFKSVSKLQPGCLMVWHNGQITVRRYYTPPFATEVPDLTNYEEATRLFRTASRTRSVSECVPTLRSARFFRAVSIPSAVVAMMVRHSTQPLRTFSVSFEEKIYSELDFCLLASKHFGTEHTDFVVTAQDFFDNWQEAVQRRGAPVSEASDIPMMLLSKMASASVKMVLTGEGADEFLAGYPKYSAERYSNLYQKLVPAALHDSMVQPAFEALPFRMRRIKVLAKAMGQRNSSDRFRIWFGDLSRKERDQLLGDRVNQAMNDYFPFSITIGSNLCKSQFFDQTSWLPNNSLEHADRMMMAGSIEGHMPFMDTELAALVARMPDQFLLRRRTSKAILRSAMKNIVPAPILTRPKNGFRVPIGHWFRHSHSGIVRDLLTSDQSQARKMLDARFIDHIVDGHLSAHLNNERVLWSLCNLKQFIRIYKPDLGAFEIAV